MAGGGSGNQRQPVWASRPSYDDFPLLTVEWSCCFVADGLASKVRRSSASSASRRFRGDRFIPKAAVDRSGVVRPAWARDYVCFAGCSGNPLPCLPHGALLAEPAYRPPSWFCLQFHHYGDPKRYLSQYDVALLTLAMAKKMRAPIKIRIILSLSD